MRVTGRGRAVSLRRNLAWTLLGGGLYQAAQWGLLVILTKLTTQTQVGDFIFATAVTAPVFLLTSLQLRAVQAVDARREHTLGEYFALRIVTTAVALVVAGIIAAAGYRGSAGLLILLWGLAKTVESLSDVFLGFMQQNERFDLMARSLVVKSLASLLVPGLVIYFTRSAAWGLVALAVSWTWRLVGFDARMTRALAREYQKEGIRVSLRPSWNWPALGRIAWRCLPLGIVVMMTSFQVNIPRYAVAHYLGSEDLAVFGATAYLTLGGALVANGLAASASPRMALHYATGDRPALMRIVTRLVGGALGVGALSVVIAAVAGRALLKLFYGEQYANQPLLLVLLMTAGLLTYVYTVLEGVMTATHYFRSQLVVNVVVLLVSLGAAYGLTYLVGLYGAAYAMIAAAGAGVAGAALVVNHAVRKLRRE